MSHPAQSSEENIELLGTKQPILAVNKNDPISKRESGNECTSEADHLKSTIALCVVSLTNSYLLISVFPYSGFLATELVESANEENAGYYAGFVSSSFMVGRALSSIPWGRAADTYGRTTTLCASLALSSIISILFGISRNFPMALAFRFLLGLENGSVGITKTVVSELAGSSAKLETRGMGLVMGMWAWGFLLSPAISGSLAEPVQQYPNNPIVQQFHPLLSRFPFLLPNVVGSILCILALLAVNIWVRETLPKEKLKSPRHIPSDSIAFVRQLFQFRNNSTAPENLPISASPTPSYGSRQQEALSLSFKTSQSRTSPDTPISSIWRRENTRTHLLVYWAYSFIFICVDEAFPLFCMSKEAGLGISEASIGKLLSGSGLLFAVCQYFSYVTLVKECGLYPSIHIGGMLACPVIAFTPLSLLFNKGMATGHLKWSTFVFLSFIMSLCRIFGSAFFSSIAIATNRTVPASQRATMNGLSMLGGSAAKGLGPAFAGLLVAFSFSSGAFPPRVGAVFVFCVIGLLGMTVAFVSYFCLKEEKGDDRNEYSNSGG